MYNDTVDLFLSRLSRDCKLAGRVYKKDVLTVMEAAESGDYSKAWGTRLYNKQGGAYCQLLCYISEQPPELFEGVQ